MISGKIRIVLWLLSFLASSLFAQSEKALPRGKGAKGKTLKVKKELHQSLDCMQYLLNRQQAHRYLTRDQKFLYFLSRIPSIEGASKKNRRDYLLKFDLTTKVIHRKLSLSAGNNPALVGLKEPLTGVIVANFVKDDGCYAGRSSAHGYRVGKKAKARIIYRKKNYFLTEEDGSLTVADPSISHALVLDTKTFQKRRSMAFVSEDWPLYLNKVEKQIFALRPSKSTLVKYQMGTNKPLKEIKLASQYRILQSRDRFAFTMVDERKNRLKIRHIKGWTGSSNGKYTLTLPSKYSVLRARFSMDFNQKMAIVFLDKPLKSRRWSRAFVVDYSRDEVIGELIIPKGHYVSSSTNFQDAQGDRGVIFILKKYGHNILSAIKIFSLENRKWEPVHIKIH